MNFDFLVTWEATVDEEHGVRVIFFHAIDMAGNLLSQIIQWNWRCMVYCSTYHDSRTLNFLFLSLDLMYTQTEVIFSLSAPDVLVDLYFPFHSFLFLSHVLGSPRRVIFLHSLLSSSFPLGSIYR